MRFLFIADFYHDWLYKEFKMIHEKKDKPRKLKKNGKVNILPPLTLEDHFLQFRYHVSHKIAYMKKPRKSGELLGN